MCEAMSKRLVLLLNQSLHYKPVFPTVCVYVCPQHAISSFTTLVLLLLSIGHVHCLFSLFILRQELPELPWLALNSPCRSHWHSVHELLASVSEVVRLQGYSIGRSEVHSYVL